MRLSLGRAMASMSSVILIANSYFKGWYRKESPNNKVRIYQSEKRPLMAIWSLSQQSDRSYLQRAPRQPIRQANSCGIIRRTPCVSPLYGDLASGTWSSFENSLDVLTDCRSAFSSLRGDSEPPCRWRMGGTRSSFSTFLDVLWSRELCIFVVVVYYRRYFISPSCN